MRDKRTQVRDAVSSPCTPRLFLIALMFTQILKWIAGFWLLATLIVVSAGLLSRPQQADLAIVYGNKVHVDGSPSSRLAARLDEARLCYE